MSALLYSGVWRYRSQIRAAAWRLSGGKDKTLSYIKVDSCKSIYCVNIAGWLLQTAG
ncbi:MAG: hypothetical protein ACLRTT_15570 [Lachnospiraceae bacterium]